MKWTRMYTRWLAVLLGVMMAIAPLMGTPNWAIAQTSLAIENAAPLSSPSSSASDDKPLPEGNNPEPTFSDLSPPGLNINLPPELTQFFSSSGINTIEYAPVRLDGRTLFQIAAPIQESSDFTYSAAQARATEIENRLQRIATQNYRPDTLDVRWELVNDYPLIYAVTVPQSSTSSDTDPSSLSNEQGENQRLGDILTVLAIDIHRPWVVQKSFDTDAFITNRDQLADSWSQVLQDALIRFKTERQRDFLIRQSQLALGLIVALIAISLSLRNAQKKLKATHKRLAIEAKETNRRISSTVDQGTPTDEDTSLLLGEEMRNRQRRSLNSLKRRLLQLAQWGLWGSGFFILVGLFPYTRWLQSFAFQLLKVPGQIILVVIICYVLIRLSAILIDRAFLLLQNSPRFLLQVSPRRMLRFSTFSSVIKNLAGFTLALITFFIVLHLVGVNIAPLLAGAGLVGFAISFAAQNLIRDLINGFLILVEDQYGVGDIVVLGEVSGFVENMGLRTTQLRNEEGRLITVPNGSITIVQNLTKDWSRVDLMIDVAHHSDIDGAIALIHQVAADMAQETHWRDLILETPLMLGVDRLDYVGATVRIWIKTKPLKQFDVAREYRRRLKIAFDKHGIDIGTPQQSVHVMADLGVSPNSEKGLALLGDNEHQNTGTRSNAADPSTSYHHSP